MKRRLLKPGSAVILAAIWFAGAFTIAAEPAGQAATPSEKTPSKDESVRQAELDASLVEMLSGATLEGSFTSTGAGKDPTKLSREKYTLGDVKKLQGNLWMIPARIQYGDHDVTIPLVLPIRWAGDTPVIVVDNVGLPGFGTVSARVMFFADHYAGYWKHGKSGGHLFGVITRDKGAAANEQDKTKSPTASGDSPHTEQEQKQRGEQ